MTSTPVLTQPVGHRDHTVGPERAALTLVEDGDYECRSCGVAFPIVKEVRRHMGVRLRFVFRNFPLTASHPHALHAAEAAEAAGAQGRFWEMHDALFEHQDVLDDAHLKTYAKVIGLDMARFDADLHARTHLSRIEEDLSSGIESGVRGTPTFYINGVRHGGRWDAVGIIDALEG